MSRLEKARAQKHHGKKKAFVTLAAIVLAVLAAGTFYLSQDGSPDFFSGGEPDLIDRERTEAFVDIFGLTYVRVYLVEGFDSSEVTVNGEEMRYSSDHNRWELVISDYEEGDQLVVAVTLEQGSTQELSILVREM